MKLAPNDLHPASVFVFHLPISLFALRLFSLVQGFFKMQQFKLLASCTTEAQPQKEN